MYMHTLLDESDWDMGWTGLLASGQEGDTWEKGKETLYIFPNWAVFKQLSKPHWSESEWIPAKVQQSLDTPP
jgi:hypothetical protein